jgi:SH3-like domain-containing protein
MIDLGRNRKSRAAGSRASVTDGRAKTRIGSPPPGKHMNRSCRARAGLVFLWFAAASALAGSALADPVGSVTKLPLPRFASLKTDRVNLREGPSKEHATKWVYERAGLPVEITAEFEVWRRVRDSEGVDGWVLHSLLSGRRTGLVTPNKKDESTKIFTRASETADLAATLQSGVIVNIRSCDGGWCLVDGDGFKGYIQQLKLWGVYPNEKIP